MNKLRRLRSLSPEMAETLRLAGVQGIFWAAMAVGNYQTVYLQSIGFPATDFGLLNAIACAVAIFAMTFWGTVSDRIGSVRKIVILTLTLGCGLFIFVPLIPTGQSYSTLLFLILIPIINFFRVPMSPFVDNLTVRNCAEHRLNYGMVRSSGSLLFAIAGVITVNALIPAAGVPSTFWVMGIVMIPAIVLTYFCFEPQSGKRVKKERNGFDSVRPDGRHKGGGSARYTPCGRSTSVSRITAFTLTWKIPPVKGHGGIFLNEIFRMHEDSSGKRPGGFCKCVGERQLRTPLCDALFAVHSGRFPPSHSASCSGDSRIRPGTGSARPFSSMATITT